MKECGLQLVSWVHTGSLLSTLDRNIRKMLFVPVRPSAVETSVNVLQMFLNITPLVSLNLFLPLSPSFFETSKKKSFSALGSCKHCINTHRERSSKQRSHVSARAFCSCVQLLSRQTLEWFQLSSSSQSSLVGVCTGN